MQTSRSLVPLAVLLALAVGYAIGAQQPNAAHTSPVATGPTTWLTPSADGTTLTVCTLRDSKGVEARSFRAVHDPSAEYLAQFPKPPAATPRLAETVFVPK
jgi:hypothetical protein